MCVCVCVCVYVCVYSSQYTIKVMEQFPSNYFGFVSKLVWHFMLLCVVEKRAYLLSLACPSLRMHQRAAWTAHISVRFDIGGILLQISLENFNFWSKSREKCQTLYVKTYVRLIFVGDINQPWKHCCAIQLIYIVDSFSDINEVKRKCRCLPAAKKKMVRENAKMLVKS